MKQFLYSLAIFSLTILFVQCTAKKGARAAIPSLVTPKLYSIAQARWPSITQHDLEMGRSIFTTRCSKCHKAQAVKSRSEREWVKVIIKMAPKAKLTEEEKIKLTQYVFAARKAGKS